MPLLAENDHSLPVIIAQGQSLSYPANGTVTTPGTPVDLGPSLLIGIYMDPFGWDSAVLSFQVSPDGTAANAQNVYDSTHTEYSVTVAAGDFCAISPGDPIYSIRYLVIRSGLHNAAVNQTVLRTLKLVVKT